MPTYTITDSQTGRTLRVQGDSPPTEEEAQQLFAASAPGLVAGTSEQMREQRAANLQQELGLTDPIAPYPARQGQVMGTGGLGFIGQELQPGALPASQRFVAGFAPTAEEKRKYFENEYGPGSFIPLAKDNALIRVPDGEGKFKWVLENPAGLDAGDIAEIASSIPEFVAGSAAALAALPGPQGTLAKAVVASGASSLAANTLGAVQDAVVRMAMGEPVRPGEIAERRGLKAGIEMLTSVPLTYGAERIARGSRITSAAGDAVKRFIKEGDEAKKRLAAGGIDVPASTDVADAIRAQQPANITATEAGEKVADALTTLDRQIQAGSKRLIERAAESGEQRALGLIASGTGAGPVSPVKAGEAAIGGIKLVAARNKQAVDKLYEKAYADIGAAADATGAGRFFVKLSETEKVLNKLEGRILVAAKEEGDVTGDVFAPFRATIMAMKKSTEPLQTLEAARQARTMLGEKAFKGKDGVFGNIAERDAKELYAALSKDIDDSINALGGPGAASLRAANDAYRKLVEPYEQSKLLDKVLNDGFDSPEKLVDAMSAGTVAEWQALKGQLGANTYNDLRRAVADRMVGASRVDIGGKSLADLSRLSANIDAQAARAPEVLDEVFGGRSNWQALQKIAKEFDFIRSKKGLFLNPALPSMDELAQARQIASEQGFDAANGFLRRAISAAEKRRDTLAESLVSLVRNGNTRHVSENPEAFFDAFVVSGRHDARYIDGVMRKMPTELREQVARAGFQRLFENARILSKSTVGGGKGSYDVEKMLGQVFGSEQAQARVRAVLGDRRFDTLRDWMRYELSLEVAAKRPAEQGKRLAGLISTAPYQNLFAARAASMALEKASGSRLVREVGPDAVQLFSDARLLVQQPQKSAAAISLIQRASANPAFGDYLEMMNGFTPEQQQAVDEYLLGR